MVKVDFEKAYDSVDLGCLYDVMRKMNFPTLWRKWSKNTLVRLQLQCWLLVIPYISFHWKEG